MSYIPSIPAASNLFTMWHSSRTRMHTTVLVKLGTQSMKELRKKERESEGVRERRSEGGKERGMEGKSEGWKGRRME